MKNTFLPALVSLLSSVALHAAVLPEAQKIDSLLKQEWDKNNLKPNPAAPDDVMVRRLYLDLAGRIPSVEETAEFMNSREPDKRAKLIDKLLASDGFTSTMFNYWADILRLTDNTKGKTTAEAYAEYVKRCIKENKPYDKFVSDLLTTDGGVWDSGAVGFYVRDDNKLDHLAYTVQVFLGTSIVCAQCHNHPFDKWSQTDYYGMAAYTYGMDGGKGNNGVLLPDVKRKGGKLTSVDPKAFKTMSKEDRKKALEEQKVQREAMEKEREAKGITKEAIAEVKRTLQDITKPLRYTNIAYNGDKLPGLPSDYKYPDAKPGQTIHPKTMFGHEAVPVEGETRIMAFAKWMTSPENPRFSTVIANRMWKKVFGMGLIEPVDEMTDSTVPSNSELMEYLTELMKDKKFSLKSFLRVLYNTDTYQRMASTTEVPLGETYHFTGPTLRRMSAEQIWDSMVTLAKGNVDSETSEENENLHNYLGDLKLLLTTVREKGAEGLIEISKRPDGSGADNVKKMDELRAKAIKAQNEGDKQAARQLTAEAEKLRKQSSSDLLAAILGPERAQGLRKGYGKSKNDKVEFDKAALASLSKEERRQAQKMGASINLTHRASEISSPAKPGHFLRTFGQSDREQISNASDDASVPQALALLNGPITAVLSNPMSKLRRDLAVATAPEQQMDMLYMAFLCRHPNANEKALLNQVIADRGDKAVADVTHALLTGSQFLFIQ